MQAVFNSLCFENDCDLNCHMNLLATFILEKVKCFRLQNLKHWRTKMETVTWEQCTLAQNFSYGTEECEKIKKRIFELKKQKSGESHINHRARTIIYDISRLDSEIKHLEDLLALMDSED